jgi:molybdate transport system substrate-binding protein
MWMGPVALALVIVALPVRAAERPPLRVAAASDLALAFEQIGRIFEKRTGEKVTFIFGSTGLLARQIVHGAPFDVFAAANVEYVDDVVRAGACDPATKSLYARGRIVIWTRMGAPGAAPASPRDLADRRFRKVAIAHPDHAPYGRAARQALERSGVWEALKPRLVYGENVQQALRFVRSGNADAGIVALSLAMAAGGDHVLVASELHDPLDQALVICKRAARPDAARSFVALVGSAEGRAVMRRYGFILPGESLTRNR